jgi:hypothetical protein
MPVFVDQQINGYLLLWTCNAYFVPVLGLFSRKLESRSGVNDVLKWSTGIALLSLFRWRHFPISNPAVRQVQHISSLQLLNGEIFFPGAGGGGGEGVTGRGLSDQSSNMLMFLLSTSSGLIVNGPIPSFPRPLAN